MSQLQLIKMKPVAASVTTEDAKWDESKHPRKHGQFAPKGSGTTGKTGGKSGGAKSNSGEALSMKSLTKEAAKSGWTPSLIKEANKLLDKSIVAGKEIHCPKGLKVKNDGFNYCFVKAYTPEEFGKKSSVRAATKSSSKVGKKRSNTRFSKKDLQEMKRGTSWYDRRMADPKYADRAASRMKKLLQKYAKNGLVM